MNATESLSMLRRLVIVCALLSLLSLAACSSRKTIPVGEIPKVSKPSKQVVKMTYSAIAQRANSKRQVLLQSGSEYNRVRNILSKLTAALGTPSDTWPLYIVDGHDVANASAVNQNSIVVYTGLIRRIRDDSMLAAIMGHEIAHILAKHGPDKDRKKKVGTTNMIGNMLGLAVSVGAAVAGVDPNSANSLGGLAHKGTAVVGQGAILSFDRSQETEADHVGLMIMAKAGYDPRAAVKVWENSEKIFGGSNSFSFLSTHPSGSARIDDLKDAMPKALKLYQARTGVGVASR
jgi:predicted Zn-dependent protease